MVFGGITIDSLYRLHTLAGWFDAAELAALEAISSNIASGEMVVDGDAAVAAWLAERTKAGGVGSGD